MNQSTTLATKRDLSHTRFQLLRLKLDPSAEAISYLERLFSVSRSVHNHFVRQMQPFQNTEAKRYVQTLEEMEDSMVRWIDGEPAYSFVAEADPEYLVGSLYDAWYRWHVFQERNAVRPDYVSVQEAQAIYLLDTSRFAWGRLGVYLPGYGDILLHFDKPEYLHSRPTTIRVARVATGSYYLDVLWDHPNGGPDLLTAPAQIALGMRLSIARRRYFKMRKLKEEGRVIDDAKMLAIRSDMWKMRIDAMEFMYRGWRGESPFVPKELEAA